MSGSQLKKIRQAMNLSQQELSELTDVRRATISAAERREGRAISYKLETQVRNVMLSRNYQQPANISEDKIVAALKEIQAQMDDLEVKLSEVMDTAKSNQAQLNCIFKKLKISSRRRPRGA